MDKLIKIAKFSTEAGTIAREIGENGPVPVIVSSTDIAQAHKQNDEYTTLGQLNEQFALYSDILNTIREKPIKKITGLSISGTIQNFCDHEKLDYKQFMEYLDWFDDQQTNQPFALIRAESSQLDEQDRIKLAKKLTEFKEIMGLYPIVVTDINDFDKSFPSRKMDYEKNSNNFHYALRNAGKMGDILLVQDESSRLSEICDAIISNKISSPLKYIYLEKNGGIKAMDRANGHKVISRIDFNKILSNPNEFSHIKKEELWGLLKRNEIDSKSYQSLYEAHSHFASIEGNNDMMSARQKKVRSMQLVSVKDLYLELFTVEGAGTLIRRGYDIGANNFNGGQCDIIYEKSNGIGNLEDYLKEETGEKKDILGYLVASSKKLDDVDVIKINKLVIAADFWRQDLPERLLEEILAKEKPFYWAASKGTPLYTNSDRLLESIRSNKYFIEKDQIPGTNGGEVYIGGLNSLSERSYKIRSEIIKEVVKEL